MDKNIDADKKIGEKKSSIPGAYKGPRVRISLAMVQEAIGAKEDFSPRTDEAIVGDDFQNSDA